jgi:hypothetical protein
VPGTKNEASVLVNGAHHGSVECCANGDVQQAPISHLQGMGPDMNPNNGYTA